MLQPFFLLLLLRKALILEGLLELRQPLLPLDMLRYQIAVIVLQRYLQKTKCNIFTCNAPIIIVSNPHDIIIIFLLLLLSSRELDVTRSITFYLVQQNHFRWPHATASQLVRLLRFPRSSLHSLSRNTSVTMLFFVRSHRE